MDFVEYPILVGVLGVESSDCLDICAKGSEFDCLLRWCDSPFENFLVSCVASVCFDHVEVFIYIKIWILIIVGGGYLGFKLGSSSSLVYF